MSVEATVSAMKTALRSGSNPPSARYRVWSSPSLRCAEPARQLARHLDGALTVDPRLYELDFGDWEGQSWNDIARQDAEHWDRWCHDWKQVAPPHGERLDELEDRVDRWRREVSIAASTETPLLIGHAGVIRALTVQTTTTSWDEVMRRPIPYLTLIHL